MIVRIIIGTFLVLIGLIALCSNSYLLGTGALRWAHEHDLWEQIALASGGGSVPWLLAFWPIIASIVVSGGTLSRTGQNGLLLGLWAIFMAYNLMMGTSNIATLREEKVATINHSVDTATRQVEARSALADQRKGIPQHRPADTVMALIKAEKLKKWFANSDECRDARTRDQRLGCQGIEALEAEMASGRKAEELTAQIAVIDAELAKVPAGASKNSADPFAQQASAYTGLSEGTVRVLQAMATPVVLEIIGSVSFKLAFLVFGLSINTPLPGRGGVKEAVQPILAIETHEAMNRRPEASEAVLTRGRQIAEWFWRECARPLAEGSYPETQWYEHYVATCQRSKDTPIPRENFRRIAKRCIGLTIQDLDDGPYYQGYAPHVPAEQAA